MNGVAVAALGVLALQVVYLWRKLKAHEARLRALVRRVERTRRRQRQLIASAAPWDLYLLHPADTLRLLGLPDQFGWLTLGLPAAQARRRGWFEQEDWLISSFQWDSQQWSVQVFIASGRVVSIMFAPDSRSEDTADFWVTRLGPPDQRFETALGPSLTWSRHVNLRLNRGCLSVFARPTALFPAAL